MMFPVVLQMRSVRNEVVLTTIGFNDKEEMPKAYDVKARLVMSRVKGVQDVVYHRKFSGPYYCVLSVVYHHCIF